MCSHWPCACMAGARGRLVRCGFERPSRRCAPAPGRAGATVHVCTRCGDDPPEAERPGSSQFLACGGAVCAGPTLAAVCVPTRCARAPVPAREPRLRGTWCLCRSRVRVAALGGPGCHCRSRVRRSRVLRGRGGARPHSLRRWSLSAEAWSMSLQRCQCTLAACWRPRRRCHWATQLHQPQTGLKVHDTHNGERSVLTQREARDGPPVLDDGRAILLERLDGGQARNVHGRLADPGPLEALLWAI